MTDLKFFKLCYEVQRLDDQIREELFHSSALDYIFSHYSPSVIRYALEEYTPSIEGVTDE